MSYKKLRDALGNIDQTRILRLADNATIPADETNADYRDYLSWLAAPNTPTDADPAPIPPTPEETSAVQRAAAVAQLTTDPMPTSKFIRAVILLTLDEINLLRQRETDHAADVAAATTLADLKTRWAARAAMPDRTIAQLKTAIENKINAGTAD